jgi:acid phosphatase
MGKKGWTLWVLCLVACLGFGSKPSVPKYDHVVIVMEENHSYKDILEKGKKACPYIQRLAKEGALFTNSYGVSHPSLPNYLALLSGSTQGVTDDDSGCAYSFKGDQLASQLLKAGLTFAGYSEDLPSEGSTLCQGGGKDAYYRKHNPWVYWQISGEIPPSANKTFASFPKGPDYGSLPTVSFVIPNEAHDMHEPNGFPPAADKWLKKRLDGYARWAKAHNSLLIVTWDEDNYAEDNHIPTLFIGAHVRPGTYGTRIDHYSLLRTIEEMYGLKPLANAKKARVITEVFDMAEAGK